MLGQGPEKELSMRNWILLLMATALVVPLARGGEDDARRLYEGKLAALSADDVPGHYLLGLWCRKEGLSAEAESTFERVVALSPDHEGARRELGYVRHGDRWLTRDEAMSAKGLVLHEGVWMLPEQVERLLLPQTEKERMREEAAKAEKILVTLAAARPAVEKYAVSALEGIEDRCKVEPLAYALRHKSEKVRKFAAEELGRIGDRRALRPLIYRSIMDPSAQVRGAALASVKAFDDPNLLAPYVKAMYSESQPVRINAVEAVGELGEVMGIEYLVYKISAHGGGLTRSHIYLASQLSFIQDYDVEVAQTAFIADPIVGILQEGQVLDVRVIATERTADLIEQRAIRRSLKRLSGVDLGDSPVAWARWWKENKARLLAKN
jgi:hypothetical protein